MNLTLTNKDGTVLDLLNNERRIILTGADALHGIETSIAGSESPYMDGEQIQSVKALPRGIELTFNVIPPIDDALTFFTSIVKSKQYVTLTEKTKDHEITIKGIATIPPYSRMQATCKISLQIYCGQPYWEDLQTVIGEIENAISMLFFPQVGQYFTETGRVFGVIDTTLQKVFTNDGDVAVGALFRLTPLGTVVNPRISCSTGAQNGWYMQLNVEVDASHEILINTVKGNKYITINGSTMYKGIPVLSCLEFVGDDWLQLETGANRFNVTAQSGADDLFFSITYRRRYE